MFLESHDWSALFQSNLAYSDLSTLEGLIVVGNRKQMARVVFSSALVASCLMSDAFAKAPTVSQITTDFERQHISVSGSDFGSAPNVLIYDTFDSVSGITGESIPLNASEVGNWTEFNPYYLPSYAETSRSGSHSVKVFDGATQNTNPLRLKFDGTQEFFVSYWIYLEGPNYFPGDQVTAPETFSRDSSFKMLWVFDTDVKGESSDVVLPTHVGNGVFYLAGNDTNLVTDVGNEWWNWDNWMRVSFWLKADPQNPTGPGIIHFDTLSKEKGHTERVYNVPVFDADGPEVKQYQHMNFPGWIRSIQNSSTNILYDDIYVSTGPNAAARLELGDAPNLNEVTRLELLTIKSWSDTSIQATASTVEDEDLRDLYLYITNANGETNTKGIPLISPPGRIEAIEVK